MRRDFLKLCGMAGLGLVVPGGITSLLRAAPKEATSQASRPDLARSNVARASRRLGNPATHPFVRPQHGVKPHTRFLS